MLSAKEKIDGLKAIVASDPADHLGRFMLGKLLIDEKCFDEAAEQLGAVVELQPGYSAAYRQWGDALRFAGKSDEAAAVYRNGIVVAEKNGDLQTLKEMQAFLKRLEEKG